MAVLVGSRRSDDGSSRIALALPPADGVTSRLVDGYLPAVENRWTAGDLQIEQLAFATCCGKFESITGREPLVAMVRYTVTNKSSSPREMELALQFGGVFRDHERQNDSAAYPPQARFRVAVHSAGERHVSCLPADRRSEGIVAFKPISGPKPAADGNRLSTRLALGPGRSKSVDLAVPYFALPAEAARQLAALRVDDELGKFRKFWSRELNRGAEFIVPEKRFRDAYRACAASNFILIDRDPTTGVLMPHPDALVYEAVWAGDGSVSIQATDRMGYHKEAESMLDYFLARQGKEKPEGDVTVGRRLFLRRRRPEMDEPRRLRALGAGRALQIDPRRRLAPPRRPANAEGLRLDHPRAGPDEGDGKRQEGRSTTACCPRGDRPICTSGTIGIGPTPIATWACARTADVLAAIGMKDEAAWLAAEADDYKACILASIDRSMNRKVKPPFVLAEPHTASVRPAPISSTHTGTRSAARSTWSRRGCSMRKTRKSGDT